MVTQAASKDIAIESDERGSYFYLKVNGHFGGSNIVEVRKAVEEALSIGHTKIALDLSGITFFDSMAVGLLTNLKKKLEEAKGLIGILNPSPAVDDILSVSGGDGFYSIYRNVTDVDFLFD